MELETRALVRLVTHIHRYLVVMIIRTRILIINKQGNLPKRKRNLRNQSLNLIEIAKQDHKKIRILYKISNS